MWGKKRRAAEQARLAKEAAKAQAAAERSRQLHELFNRALAGDLEAEEEVMKNHTQHKNSVTSYPHFDLPEVLQERVREILSARKARLRAPDERLKQLLENSRSAQGGQAQIEALLAILEFTKKSYMGHPEEEFLKTELGTAEYVKQLLHEAVQRRYTELLALRDQSEHFHMLHALITRTRESWIRRDGNARWHDNDLKTIGIAKLPYPPDWNDLVARHYAAPSLKDFSDLPEEWDEGDVRLLAAQAVGSRNLTDAQIALAYCRKEAYLQAVGDVLTAQLANVVNELRGVTLTAAQSQSE